MRQITTIYLYYLNAYPVLVWLFRVGAAVFVTGVVTRFLFPGFAAMAILWGFVGALVLPYIVLFATFRELISNRRLAMLAGFHFQACIALFLLTLSVSLCLPLAGLVLNLDMFQPKLGLQLFIACTVYHGFLQSLITSRYFPYLMGIGIWLVVGPMLYFKDWVPVFFNSMLFTAGGSLLSLVGWGIALVRMRQRDKYKPAYRPYNEKEVMRGIWDTDEKLPGSSTTAGTLLLGLPDGHITMLWMSAIWVIGMPLVMSLFLALVDLLDASENTLPIGLIFLACSAMCGALSALPVGELAARARLLWLRIGGDRLSQWRHLEKLIWRGTFVLYAWALAVILVMALFTESSNNVLANYFTFIIVVQLFIVYIGLFLRIIKWPNLIKGLLMFVLFTVTISIAGKGMESGYFLLLNILEVVYLLTALVLRHITRNIFTDIDWYQVQPMKFGTTYRQEA